MTTRSSFWYDDHGRSGGHLLVIIWRPWSSFQNDDHQWGYGHHFGRMLARTLTRTLTTSLLVKFAFFLVHFLGGIFKCTGPAMPTNTWPIKIPLTVSGSEGQKTNLCIVWQFPPGLSWWRVFAYHHHAALILGMFWHKTLRYVHIKAFCVCAKLAGGQW